MPKGRGSGDDYDNDVGRESGDLREPEGVDARAGRTDAERLDDLISRALAGETVADADLSRAAVACGLSLEDARNRIASERSERACESSRRDIESIRADEARAADALRKGEEEARSLEAKAAEKRRSAAADAAAARAGLDASASAMRQRELELMGSARELSERHASAKARIVAVNKNLRMIEHSLDVQLRRVRAELTELRSHMVAAGVPTAGAEAQARADREADVRFAERRDAETRRDADDVDIAVGLKANDPAEAEDRRQRAAVMDQERVMREVASSRPGPDEQ